MVGRAQVEDLQGYVTLLIGTHVELSLFCTSSKQFQLTNERTAHLAACLCDTTHALLDTHLSPSSEALKGGRALHVSLAIKSCTLA